MHDLGHDLALSVSKFDTFVFQQGSTLTANEVSRIRYLNICYDGEPLPRILTVVAPKLHSLLSEIDVSEKLSRTFRSLRVLKFAGGKEIRKLPASLGELKRLRYFDISKTSINALPRSTIKLYNLQTLRFMGCKGIRFPDGLRNLISLKHIHFDDQSSQPIKLRHLTSLQTLPMFFVGSTRERYHYLDALKCLNELGGELKICKLELVRDKQVADGANLQHKEKVCKLIFEWRGSADNSEEVMEGLQPHSNLQSLIVRNYPGECFPSWMLRLVHVSNACLLLLDNLMELEFIECFNCESPRPLGQLHNLKFLKLKKLEKVKRMGNEFYNNGSSSDGKNEVFPALKRLSLEEMISLEEWTGIARTVVFPCLEELVISGCPLLKSVPLTGPCFSLQKLRIEGCYSLSCIGDGVATSMHFKEITIKKCPSLRTVPKFEGISSLKSLLDTGCDELDFIPITGSFSSLEKLYIGDCWRLRKIEDGRLPPLLSKY